MKTSDRMGGWSIGVKVGAAYVVEGGPDALTSSAVLHGPEGVRIEVAMLVALRLEEPLGGLRERLLGRAIEALGQAHEALSRVPLPDLEQEDRAAARRMTAAHPLADDDFD